MKVMMMMGDLQPFLLQASLKERFDWEGTSSPQWQVLEGGRPCTDCGVLVEGTALYFGGADARHAVTADLDLRGAKLVFTQRFSLSLGSAGLVTLTCGFCD